MRILALDSSSKTAGVCILQNGEVLFRQTLNQGLTHSQTLLPLVQAALKQAGLSLQDISALGVTAGPGSFTGLRIGLALVKGLALPLGLPVAPVSALQARAAGCAEEGVLVAAMDARRGEVYWAAFEKVGEECRRLSPDEASLPAEIFNRIDLLKKDAVFIGDGAQLCYNNGIIKGNSGESVRARVAETDPAYGAALLAARLFVQGQLLPTEELRPNYIRLPQAERERAQRQAAAEKK